MAGLTGVAVYFVTFTITRIVLSKNMQPRTTVIPWEVMMHGSRYQIDSASVRRNGRKGY